MSKNSNNLVTKDYLDKRFKPIGSDIKDLKHDVSGLKRDVYGLKQGFSNLSQAIINLRNEMIEMKDTILGELKAMREDNEAHNFLHQTTDDSLDTVNDTLGNHERRLKKLEKPTL